MTPPLRIVTNTPWLDGHASAGRAVEPVRVDRMPAWRAALACLAVWRHDAALLNIDARSLLLLCAAKKLLPFARCRLLSVDLILNHPGRGLRARLAFRVRRWLLKEVDRFAVYARDTAELRRVYALPAERVRYVPFKVNTHDEVLRTPVSDEGFFLSCGRSNRDIATLCAAFRGLPYRCVALATWGQAADHGTQVDGIEWPPNVERVDHDGATASWNDWISRAHAVVIPVQPGILAPSGISTYPVAMAMGKCVIITDSPATHGVLDERTAVLVPPGDPEALRAAVVRVAEDAELRASVAAAGRRYALSLGGEERLRADLLRELDDLLAARPVRAAAAPAVAPALPE
ncbi:glycosyltransferase [Longimicrobium sp.]|uniref:glycosyltransferase n=1 Tax=Longimicrobium sp. TaxID=2029185 RepID=UPI002BFEBFD5|nr:glycosyltransferase [Longimicrobium sp.]HSU13295.1 glycosyltransferase [Longimicrobium sp.]